jgi:hypothetical protein
MLLYTRNSGDILEGWGLDTEDVETFMYTHSRLRFASRIDTPDCLNVSLSNLSNTKPSFSDSEITVPPPEAK